MTMMEFVYRFLKNDEAESASVLEKECLDTAWTKEQIANLPENAFYMGAFCGNTLCGVLSAYFVADEVQIMNLAVSPSFRRNGIAFGLLERLLIEAENRKSAIISLEVAENNLSALALYEKLGFKHVGKRKGFYGDISAIIMEKTFD